jgi:hypothetical protein
MASYRRRFVENSIKFIGLFESNEFVTAKMIMKELGICRSNAHRWIRDASMVMPIYESGKIRTGKPGFETIKYRLLGE